MSKAARFTGHRRGQRLVPGVTSPRLSMRRATYTKSTTPRNPQNWSFRVEIPYVTETKILESIKGYETVNGLYCAVQNAWVDGKPGGNSYVYLPFGLWVKSEIYTPDGSHLLVEERYDIEVAEPDPELVRIPIGYAIDDREEQ